MKIITPLILLATSLSSFASVIFDFQDGIIFDANNPSQQVGTFNLSVVSSGLALNNSTPIQAFQIAGSTNIAIQGTGTAFDQDPTISFSITLTDSSLSIESFNVASTGTIDGSFAASNNGLGFNIGNGNNVDNAADLGLSFNVGGTFTTQNVGPGAFIFDDDNSDIDEDGALTAGQIAAADALQSGSHSDDTFLFIPDTPIGNGDTLQTTITSFDGNSIADEAFRFDLVIVPEPSSTALLGLGALALFTRRKR